MIGTTEKKRPSINKGRGATVSPAARYTSTTSEPYDDGWELGEEPEKLKTTVTDEKARTIISRNQSPDVPFTQSINPYRGCEHGCIYCYARPTHAYMDLSPGLDFETRLYAKPNAAELLRHELADPRYRCRPIAMGTNTDVYQPIERERKLTRSLIKVLHDHKHPLMLTTKSSLVERDMDLLTDMAVDQLVSVYVSVTTLDHDLARHMEPRATAPKRRLQTIARLADAGIPVGVLFAPVIVFLNDHEMENILEQAAQAGAYRAGYVMLRLPQEVAPLFEQWLADHRPLAAKRILAAIRDMRDGELNDSRYGQRMRGNGPMAYLIRQRYHLCCDRLGFNQEYIALNTTDFIPPAVNDAQLKLW